MSKKVEFTIVNESGPITSSSKFDRALDEVFDVSLIRLRSTYKNAPIRLSTTPERFIEFLIKRDELGVTNHWKCLEVEMIDDKKIIQPVVVEV